MKCLRILILVIFLKSLDALYINNNNYDNSNAHSLANALKSLSATSSNLQQFTNLISGNQRQSVQVGGVVTRRCPNIYTNGLNEPLRIITENLLHSFTGFFNALKTLSSCKSPFLSNISRQLLTIINPLVDVSGPADNILVKVTNVLPNVFLVIENILPGLQIEPNVSKAFKVVQRALFDCINNVNAIGIINDYSIKRIEPSIKALAKAVGVLLNTIFTIVDNTANAIGTLPANVQERIVALPLLLDAVLLSVETCLVSINSKITVNSRNSIPLNVLLDAINVTLRSLTNAITSVLSTTDPNMQAVVKTLILVLGEKTNTVKTSLTGILNVVNGPTNPLVNGLTNTLVKSMVKSLNFIANPSNNRRKYNYPRYSQQRNDYFQNNFLKIPLVTKATVGLISNPKEYNIKDSQSENSSISFPHKSSTIPSGPKPSGKPKESTNKVSTSVSTHYGHKGLKGSQEPSFEVPSSVPTHEGPHVTKKLEEPNEEIELVHEGRTAPNNLEKPKEHFIEVPLSVTTNERLYGNKEPKKPEEPFSEVPSSVTTNEGIHRPKVSVKPKDPNETPSVIPTPTGSGILADLRTVLINLKDFLAGSTKINTLSDITNFILNLLNYINFATTFSTATQKLIEGKNVVGLTSPDSRHDKVSLTNLKEPLPKIIKTIVSVVETLIPHLGDEVTSLLSKSLYSIERIAKDILTIVCNNLGNPNDLGDSLKKLFGNIAFLVNTVKTVTTVTSQSPNDVPTGVTASAISLEYILSSLLNIVQLVLSKVRVVTREKNQKLCSFTNNTTKDIQTSELINDNLGQILPLVATNANEIAKKLENVLRRICREVLHITLPQLTSKLGVKQSPSNVNQSTNEVSTHDRSHILSSIKTQKAEKPEAPAEESSSTVAPNEGLHGSNVLHIATRSRKPRETTNEVSSST